MIQTHRKKITGTKIYAEKKTRKLTNSPEAAAIPIYFNAFRIVCGWRYMFVCMYVCMDTFMRSCVCKDGYMGACMCTMHACMHACMHE